MPSMGGGRFGASARGLTITIPPGSVARWQDTDGMPQVEIGPDGKIYSKGRGIFRLRPRP